MVKLHFEAQQSRLHPKHPFRQLSFGCGGKKHKKPTHRTIGWVFVFYFWALIFLPQTVQKFADNLINYSPNAADGLFGIPAKNRKGCRLQVGEWRYVSTNLSNLFSWDFFRFWIRESKLNGDNLRFFQLLLQEVLPIHSLEVQKTAPAGRCHIPTKKRYSWNIIIFRCILVFFKIRCYLRCFIRKKQHYPPYPVISHVGFEGCEQWGLVGAVIEDFWTQAMPLATPLDAWATAVEKGGRGGVCQIQKSRNRWVFRSRIHSGNLT